MLDREDEDAGGSGLLERREQPDDLGGVDHSVHGVHAVARQRQHRRRVEAGEEADDVRRAASSCAFSIRYRFGRAASTERSTSTSSATRASVAGSSSGGASSTASDSSTVSNARSPFWRSVSPLDTRSAIASAAASDGASSTEPVIGMQVAAMPRSARYRPTVAGYEVAIRTPARSPADVIGDAAGAANTSRQRPNPSRSRSATRDAGLRHLVRAGDADVDGAVLDPDRDVVRAGEQDLGVLVGERHAQAAAVGLEVEAGVVQQPVAGLGHPALGGQRDPQRAHQRRRSASRSSAIRYPPSP